MNSPVKDFCDIWVLAGGDADYRRSRPFWS